MLGRSLLGKEFAVGNNITSYVEVGKEILYLLLSEADQNLNHEVSIKILFSTGTVFFLKEVIYSRFFSYNHWAYKNIMGGF